MVAGSSATARTSGPGRASGPTHAPARPGQVLARFLAVDLSSGLMTLHAGLAEDSAVVIGLEAQPARADLYPVLRYRHRIKTFIVR
jgi:hypothetical protein